MEIFGSFKKSSKLFFDIVLKDKKNINEEK